MLGGFCGKNSVLALLSLSIDLFCNALFNDGRAWTSEWPSTKHVSRKENRHSGAICRTPTAENEAQLRLSWSKELEYPDSLIEN